MKKVASQAILTKASAGVSVLSLAFLFPGCDSVPEPLSAPEPLFPIDGASVTVRVPFALGWQPVAGADEYEVQVSPSATFGTTIHASSPVVDSVFVTIVDDGLYFWRVRSSGEWSSAQSFFVVTELDETWAFRLTSGSSSWIAGEQTLAHGAIAMDDPDAPDGAVLVQLVPSKMDMIVLFPIGATMLDFAESTFIFSAPGASPWTIEIETGSPGRIASGSADLSDVSHVLIEAGRTVDWVFTPSNSFARSADYEVVISVKATFQFYSP